MGLLDAIFDILFPFLERLPPIRAALGIILVFFLPGFAWSIILLRDLKPLERLAFSFALSIVLVTLSLLFVNRLIGLRINGMNAVLVILVVTILPVIVHYLKGLFRKTNPAVGREE